MDSREEQKRLNRQRGAMVLLFFILVSIALLLVIYWDGQQGFFPTRGDDWSLDDKIEFDGKKYKYNDNIETFLVLGLDKYSDMVDNGSYYNDQQADFLMLLLIDNQNKSFSAIQINRDTMAEINVLGVAGQKIDTVTQQIALAHTYGNGQNVSLRNTADAVSELLFGVQVDHVASVTMDAIPIVNDAVGGVTVKVIGDFSQIDETLVEGQEVKLMGQQALRYVRARKGMGEPTNAARMERQRQYMNALYRQLRVKMEKSETFAAELLLMLSEHMVSNGSANQLADLTEKLSAYEFGQIYTPEGSSRVKDELMEFYPDMEKLKKLMIDLVYLPDE